MGIIVILIAISLSIAVLFLAIFYWNMKSGQYDDTYTPSVRMLFENKTSKENATPIDPAPEAGSPRRTSSTVSKTEYLTQN